MGTGQADIVNFVFYAAIIFVILAVLSTFLVIIINRRAIEHQEEMQAIQKAKQQELLTATFEAQEKEQQRIGADIHDDIGPLLSTIKLYLTKLNYARTEEDKKEQVSFLRKQVDDVTSRVRGIARNKVPVVLKEEGLPRAIQQLVNQIDQSEVVRAELNSNWPESFRLNEKTELNLYRIVQELCNNALKHAKADKLIVNLKLQPDQIFLAVEDNGVGIAPEQLKEVRNGIGLKNIEARASLLNASFHIDSTPSVGTKMYLRIPSEKESLPQLPRKTTDAITS